MNLLSPYELRARVAPAIIVMLPLVITFISFLSLLQEPPTWLAQIIFSGVISLVLVYLLSFFVRHNGRKVENEIWESWDGPPSTRFMRWRDKMFGKELKQKLHKTVKVSCGIDLLSPEEEFQDPVAADNMISQAFAIVKAIVLHEEPQGLWLYQNAEYGFHRNLYGSRSAWFFLSVLCAGICMYVWTIWRNDALLIGSLLNAISVLASLIFGWYYIPKFMFWAANRYAENMWMTFQVVTNKNQQKGR